MHLFVFVGADEISIDCAVAQPDSAASQPASHRLASRFNCELCSSLLLFL